MTKLVVQFQYFLNNLVHPSVRAQTVEMLRHRAFLITHLAAGALALFAIPALAIKAPSVGCMEAAIILWFLTPWGLVLLLSQTGNLAIAHLCSSLNLIFFVSLCAAYTGGINSFLLVWLLIVPLEVALSGNRKMIISAFLLALIAAMTLYIISAQNLFVAPVEMAISPHFLSLFGLASAMLYATGLALSIQAQHERSEKLLMQSERNYRIIASNISDLITKHNSQGYVEYASLAAQELFGEDREYLYGTGYLERVHVADRPYFLHTLSQSFHHQKNGSLEFRIRQREPGKAGNGLYIPPEYIWVEIKCRYIAGQQSGEKGEVLAVTRDITSHKRQEQELLDAKEKADGANRAKTRFLANMSHELRTPLNAIIGFSEVLSRELKTKSSHKKHGDYARLINESGDHLLNVVNDILDMSKIEVGRFSLNPDHLDVKKQLKTILALMKHEADFRGVKLSLNIGRGVSEVIADERAFKQILLNLLSNSIKFTDHGGSVEVCADSAGDRFILNVIDDGIGIRQEDIPKLGHPFVQTDNSYKRKHEGAGLGLSVVRGLAELHGGSLKIHSELAIGTNMQIDLPLKGPKAKKPDEQLSPFTNDASTTDISFKRSASSG